MQLEYHKSTKLYREEIKTFVDKVITEEWNNTWKHSPNIYKLKKVRPNVFNYSPPYVFNRREQRILTRLRIGHTKLGHELILNKTEPNLCKNCNEEMNVEHLLVNHI